MAPIRFMLNGQPVEVTGVDPHTTLLGWLRQNGHTGSKEGCAEGECGACAVALVRADAEGRTRYVPVNSCLFLLASAHGEEIVSVEGIGSRAALHPVQQALAADGASQCGYCTPGFAVSLFAEYYRPGRNGYDPESIAGNLCRCTGYRPIADAARGLGQPKAGDPFAERLAKPAPAPAALDYQHGQQRFHRPESLAALLEMLALEPDARLIAGGTDLVVDMNQRFSRWPLLISVEAVPELQAVEERDDAFEIGAALSLNDIEARLGKKIPLLAELLPLFSSRLIRARATLGGNLGTASPIGDSPPVLMALDASVRVAGRGAERTIPLAELFTGYRTTALEPGELIQSVLVPKPLPTLSRFYKVSKRELDDISTVAGAFALHVASDGRIERARLAYGGVAATPVRATAAEQVLVGQPWNAASLARAKAAVGGVFQPISDMRGSARYRQAMITRLLDKFFAETQAPAPQAARVQP